MKDSFTTQPLISVITAVKNSVSTIERSIQSVIAQRYRRIEYIIIDGASTDGTVDVLKKYSCNIDHMVSEPDTGVYSAWNKGLALATGEWVCFLGADDFFSDISSLERIVSAMDVSLTKNIAIVYGDLSFVDSSESIIKIIRAPWEIAKQGFFTLMTIPHVATLHKRTLFTEFGKFDESFRIAGDYEFLLRVFEHYDALYIPMVIQASMTDGGMSNIPENLRCSWTERRKALMKHPRKQCMFRKRHIIAWMKITKSRINLLLYETLPRSKYYFLIRLNRIISTRIKQHLCNRSNDHM